MEETEGGGSIYAMSYEQYHCAHALRVASRRFFSVVPQARNAIAEHVMTLGLGVETISSSPVVWRLKLSKPNLGTSSRNLLEHSLGLRHGCAGFERNLPLL